MVSGCCCHTDLYLQWGSNHTISSKYSVIDSLHHRAKTICSSQKLLQQEEDHLKQALTRCKYPAWTINKIKIKTKATANKTSRGPKNSSNNIQKPHAQRGLPYKDTITIAHITDCPTVTIHAGRNYQALLSCFFDTQLTKELKTATKPPYRPLQLSSTLQMAHP